MAEPSKLQRLRRRRQRARWLRAAVLVTVLALGAISYLMLHREGRIGGEEPTRPVAGTRSAERPAVSLAEPSDAAALLPPAPSHVSAVPDADAPAVSAPPVLAAPARKLPALADSDAFVRRRAATIATQAPLARLLASKALVRHFVAATSSIARGENPLRHLAFARPDDPFEASPDDAVGFAIDARSYSRFDPLVSALAAVDAGSAVALFRELEPLCDEAYRELGYRDGRFAPVLSEAIDVLLETPQPEGSIAVERTSKSWGFADPELEALDPAQRLVLRLGPQNGRVLRTKLVELRDALGPG